MYTGGGGRGGFWWWRTRGSWQARSRTGCGGRPWPWTWFSTGRRRRGAWPSTITTWSSWTETCRSSTGTRCAGHWRLAAARAGGRRRPRDPPPALERAGIRLDPVRHKASRHGRPLSLRHKEFLVLEELLRGGGAVASAEQLLEKAWDENIDPFTHVVRVTIMTLRRKLGEPSPIETIPGAGYRIA